MSLLQGQDCLLQLTVLFLLFTSLYPVCSLAAVLPENPSDDNSDSITLQNGDQLQTTPLPTALTSTPPPPANASENNASSTNSPGEQRQAILHSIQQHMLAKLNLRDLPQDLSSDSDAEISPEMLASYHAHVEALNQRTDAPEECSGGETTHFSRQNTLYYPEHYMSAEPNPNHFQFSSGDDDDNKGEEIKYSDKDKNGNSDSLSKDSDKNTSPISPVLYNMRFDELDFSDSDRLWSIKLQLYKRKAQLEANNKRGFNPVDAVKVFRVIRTFAYGETTKRYVLLASKNVPSEDEGYVSFNITSGVKNWLMSSSGESSLELDVYIDTPQRVDTGLSLPPAVIFDIPFHHKGEHNARLLVERLNKIERIGANRVQDDLYRRRKRQTIRGVNNEFCHANPNTSSCCIRNLTVTFQELGIHSVRHPLKFQPNYCNGDCRLSSNPPTASRSTNFLMQLRDTNPTAAPEPCCVAQTGPLSVLMTINGRLTLNDIPDMIVKSCICR